MRIILLKASSADSFVQLCTVLVLFAFVLCVTYFTTRFVGSIQNVQGKNRNFELIEVFRLSNSVCLQLVRTGKRYFVIAVSKEQANVIAELNEDEFIKIRDNNDNAGEKFSQLFMKAKDRLLNKGEDNE